MSDNIKPNHTPLPWHVGMKPGPIIYDSKGGQIADMRECMLPELEHGLNATFIVKACNSHYELLEALKELEELVTAHIGEEADIWCRSSRAAIAKAEGRQA